MTNRYRWVQWNAHKRTYDAVLALMCGGYLAVFVLVSMITHQPPNDLSFPIILIRAFGTLSIVLLHVILLIGPLSRFTTRVAPLLYNRRHLGVTFFLTAFLHGALSVLFYGGFGVRDPLSAVLAGYDSYASISGFPFEVLGFVAFLVFFVLAATSHDFWLANLSPRVWKSVHMLVYPAYALVVLHVALGPLQSEPAPVYAVLLVVGAVVVTAAHLAAGVKEVRRDGGGMKSAEEWLPVPDPESIEDGSARVVVCPGGERLAVFRVGDGYTAVSSVCAHQGGPLGEGRVIDGCITCPWHGYQFDPRTGASPPPYSETVPTYEVRAEGRRLFVRASPNPPGVPSVPASLGDGEAR